MATFDDDGTDAPTEILIEGADKSFGGHQVLKGIDLSIRQGDVIAIVGGSGCGKTVLMNLVLNQLEPDAGRVLVRDYELAGSPLVSLTDVGSDEMDRIHQHWGVVFQQNALFSGSVFDNIALWLREVKNLDDDAIEPIARRVLAAVDLPAGEAFFEHDTDRLSGGMAKRLAVARALSMNPIVVIYDEPTTGLDPTSSAHVHDLIHATHFEERRGEPRRTSVIITHDKDLLKRLKPRIAMIHDGRIFFDGSLAEFEACDAPEVRPYFELMPVLHGHPQGG